MVRIKDIAERAQVSVGTVDRVLHNRGRVAEDVKRKVLQIAQELQYEPNLIARALGSNRSYLIAALIPDPESDPYWHQAKTGAERAGDALKRYGIRISFYFFDPHGAESFREQAERVTQDKPDGILIAPLFHRESLPYFAQWQQVSIPCVQFNTQIPGPDPLSFIGQNLYQSGLLAAKLLHYGLSGPDTYLVAHIAEDFANSPHLITKEQGFREYFETNGLTGTATIIHADFAEQSIHRQLDALLHQYPDLRGIFVTTSKTYVLAPFLKNLRQKNIRLVGYDLLEKNLECLNEGLIDFLINQNPRGQAYQGIACLTDYLVFRKSVPPIKYLPLDIVTRENARYYLEEEVSSEQLA
jgi:LacI family transcriptional regulator